MRATGIVRRIDHKGRIVVPKSLMIGKFSEGEVTVGYAQSVTVYNKLFDGWGYRTSIDDLGRLTIPQYVLDKMDLQEGDALEFFTGDDFLDMRVYERTERVTHASIKLKIMEQIKVLTEAMGSINSLWEEHREIPGLDANLTTCYPFDRSLDEIYDKVIEWKQDIEAEFGNMVCEGWACPKCHERDMNVIMPIEPGDPELVEHLKSLGCTDIDKDVYCSRCNISYNLPGGGDNNDKTGEVPPATQDDDSRNGAWQSNS